MSDVDTGRVTMTHDELVEALRTAMAAVADDPECSSGECCMGAGLLDAARHIVEIERLASYCPECVGAAEHAPGCYVGMMAGAAREAGLT